MCLGTVSDFKIHKNYGWQVFYINKCGRKLSQLFIHTDKRGVAGTIPIKLNKWQKDKNDYTIYGRYRTGFHIFTRKRDATLYSVYSSERIAKKVYFRDIVAKGTQRVYNPTSKNYMKNIKVIVARERYVVG